MSRTELFTLLGVWIVTLTLLTWAVIETVSRAGIGPFLGLMVGWVLLMLVCMLSFSYLVKKDEPGRPR